MYLLVSFLVLQYVSK